MEAERTPLSFICLKGKLLESSEIQKRVKITNYSCMAIGNS
jgi:hypothetical protein